MNGRQHLSEEELAAFAEDGAPLNASEAGHLDSCARCQARLEHFRVLCSALSVREETDPVRGIRSALTRVHREFPSRTREGVANLETIGNKPANIPVGTGTSRRAQRVKWWMTAGGLSAACAGGWALGLWVTQSKLEDGIPPKDVRVAPPTKKRSLGGGAYGGCGEARQINLAGGWKGRLLSWMLADSGEGQDSMMAIGKILLPRPLSEAEWLKSPVHVRSMKGTFQLFEPLTGRRRTFTAAPSYPVPTSFTFAKRKVPGRAIPEHTHTPVHKKWAGTPNLDFLVDPSMIMVMMKFDLPQGVAFPTVKRFTPEEEERMKKDARKYLKHETLKPQLAAQLPRLERFQWQMEVQHPAFGKRNLRFDFRNLRGDCKHRSFMDPNVR